MCCTLKNWKNTNECLNWVKLNWTEWMQGVDWRNDTKWFGSNEWSEWTHLNSNEVSWNEWLNVMKEWLIELSWVELNWTELSCIENEWNGMEWNGMEWNVNEWKTWMKDMNERHERKTWTKEVNERMNERNEWKKWMKEWMEWNGMEWNGMEWNGMEWNGMEWMSAPVYIKHHQTVIFSHVHALTIQFRGPVGSSKQKGVRKEKVPHNIKMWILSRAFPNLCPGSDREWQVTKGIPARWAWSSKICAMYSCHYPYWNLENPHRSTLIFYLYC